MSHPHYSQRTAKILQIALLGSVSNALLVGLKLFIGVFGHSSAMIAEAINSLSDFVADLIALIFIRISGKPQDKDHHYGHGKYETLASVVMAVVMMGVGGLLFNHSIDKVYAIVVRRSHLPSPSHQALVVAVISLSLRRGYSTDIHPVGLRYSKVQH